MAVKLQSWAPEGDPHPLGSLTDLPCDCTARSQGSPGHEEKPGTGLLADTITKAPAGSNRQTHTLVSEEGTQVTPASAISCYNPRRDRGQDR